MRALYCYYIIAKWVSLYIFLNWVPSNFRTSEQVRAHFKAEDTILEDIDSNSPKRMIVTDLGVLVDFG